MSIYIDGQDEYEKKSKTRLSKKMMKTIRYRSIICCNCSIPATHKLVTGLGCYPNYHESLICNMYSDSIQKLSDYEWDVHGIIGVYKLM